MSLTVPMALMALASLQQQTDTTVAVAATARLDLTNHAGLIVIDAWDRDEMRVRAEHGSRDRIEIESRGTVVSLRARRRMGMPAAVDYELTVPRGMALRLGGIHAEIEITGVQGEIHAESVEGNISVRQVGSVNLSTVEGDIEVDGAAGAVRVHGIDGDIYVREVSGGPVRAETIDGDLTLENIETGNVDASTVDGEVQYRGTIRDGGTYRFISHDGDIVLWVPTNLNATVSVATFDGEFEAEPAFRVQVTQARPGKRFSFVLGSGSAQVELESFDGVILLRQQ